MRVHRLLEADYPGGQPVGEFSPDDPHDPERPVDPPEGKRIEVAGKSYLVVRVDLLYQRPPQSDDVALLRPGVLLVRPDEQLHLPWSSGKRSAGERRVSRRRRPGRAGS